MDLTVCAVAWYLCGYAFAFGNDLNGFIGTSYWVGVDVGSASSGASSFSYWLFEYTFAATSATIVSGAVAERARFETYLCYSFFLSFWVYPIITHWIWGGGWLTLGNNGGRAPYQLGVIDFAGDGPVHMIGGLAGAIASKIMGPRIGRFDPETGLPMPIPGHSSSLATLGTFILWVGWLGFNPGSVVAVTGGGGDLAARAAVNTILASASGALSALFFDSFGSGAAEYDLGMALNGALAGLVAITGSCAFVEMWAALTIGAISGPVYVYGSRFTLNVLKIDDPLDATPVHLYCGIWGLIAGGFFAVPHLVQQIGRFPETPFIYGGVFYGGYGYLLANQITEIVVVIGWTALNVTPFFLFLQWKGILRVPQEIEEEGLDSSHHGGSAYPELFHASYFTSEAKHVPNGADSKPAAADEKKADDVVQTV